MWRQVLLLTILTSQLHLYKASATCCYHEQCFSWYSCGAQFNIHLIRDTAAIMRTMTEGLASLPTHLENLTWANKLSVQDGQLVSKNF